jgi:hypothetical protein
MRMYGFKMKKDLINNINPNKINELVNLVIGSHNDENTIEGILSHARSLEKESPQDLSGLYGMLLLARNKKSLMKININWGDKATNQVAIRHFYDEFSGVGPFAKETARIKAMTEEEKLRADLQKYFIAYRNSLNGRASNIIESPYSEFGEWLVKNHQILCVARKDSSNPDKYTIDIFEKNKKKPPMIYEFFIPQCSFGNWMTGLCEYFEKETGQKVISSIHSSELKNSEKTETRFFLNPIMI